jgi:hypothetical protein
MDKENPAVVIAIITAIVSLLGIFIKFLLDLLKSSSDINNKRRIDSIDKNIEETRKYLDAYSDISLKLTHYHNHIILSQSTARYRNEFEKINELIATTSTKVAGLALLGDKRLIELDDALIEAIKSELQVISGIQMKIASGGGFDKEIMLALVPEFSKVKAEVLGEMYRRLNTIFQNVTK